MLKFRVRAIKRNLPKAKGRDKLGHGSGPQGRIDRMRELVTALVRHERIEGIYVYLDESRGYAERLIQEAQKHGDTDAKTMELADYWLLEKDLVHKLFKVLVPRYTNFPRSYTKMWMLPTIYPGKDIRNAVLELKGNPWPPVDGKQRDVRGSLVNVLLDETKREYRQEKYEQFVSSVHETTQNSTIHNNMNSIEDGVTLSSTLDSSESLGSHTREEDGTPV